VIQNSRYHRLVITVNGWDKEQLGMKILLWLKPSKLIDRKADLLIITPGKHAR